MYNGGTARKKAKSKWSLDTDIEVENPFDRREVCIFIGIYSCCVLFLVCMYEYLMPVFNNPHYPFYNHELDYTFNPPMRTNRTRIQ